MLAVALPLAFYQDRPDVHPATAFLYINGSLIAWPLAGASLGKDNGRMMVGALIGVVLYVLWMYTLIPKVH